MNRLAYTLTVLGYLRYDETLGKYALDAGVLSLGRAAVEGTIDLARPHMQASRAIAPCRSAAATADMIYLERSAARPR